MKNELMTMRIPKPKGYADYAMLIMILKTFLSSSSVLYYNETMDTVLTGAAVLMFVLAILRQGYTIRELFLCMIVSVIALYSCLQCGNSALLITILTCLAIRTKAPEKVVEFMFRYNVLFFAVHTFIALLSAAVLGSKLTVMYYGVMRFHLGLGNKNRLAIIVFNLLLAWIYLHFDNIKQKNIAQIIAIGIIVYLATGTRTFLVEIAFLLLILYLAKRPITRTQCPLTMPTKVIFPMAALIMILLVVNYTSYNAILVQIDNFLSARIRLGAYAYARDGFTLLGQRVDGTAVWDEVYKLNSFTFDNIYTSLAINQGIIWIILLSIAFFFMAKKGDVKNNFVLIIWTLYGITEVHGLNCYMFFPLVLLAQLLTKREQRKTVGVL